MTVKLRTKRLQSRKKSKIRKKTGKKGKTVVKNQMMPMEKLSLQLPLTINEFIMFSDLFDLHSHTSRTFHISSQFHFYFIFYG